MAGKVYLVGAGPGDIELLTVKGQRLVSEADIILYDSLVNPAILDFCGDKCEKIFVGKRFGQHSMPQHKINERLLMACQSNKKVVRLKGGDPVIFSRGGEELAFLKKHGIEIEIIPGVTTAMAAAASLQVPLTHRDFGQSVIFLSGYSKPSRDNASGLPAYDWNFLANASLTLVFYMGLYHLKQICNELVNHGKNENTPVAIISNSSLSNEKTYIFDLKEMANTDISGKIEFPALVIIGQVLELKNIQKQAETRQASSQKTALILLFHGARLLEESPLPEDLVKKLRKDLEFHAISYAFLAEKFSPNYEEVIKNQVGQSFNQIIIWPIFLLPGKHLNEDIPALVEDCRALYPEVQFELWPAPQLAREFYTPLTNMALSLLQR